MDRRTARAARPPLPSPVHPSSTRRDGTARDCAAPKKYRAMRRPPPRAPRHRAIMAVDVEASTTRTNPDKIVLRAALYRLFGAALQTGGITRRHRDPLINCGDGILTLIHPADHAPKTLLLNPV